MKHGLFVLSVCGLSVASAQAARAQSAVERNLPLAQAPSGAPAVEVESVPSSEDATPLGADLRAIVLLGAGDPAYPDVTVPGGVHLTKVTVLNDIATRRALSRFIGKPLSHKLIAQISTEIARQFRRVDLPFVSLSTPEQEITGGVLQIRTVEFHAGGVDVTGVPAAEAAAIRSGIRLQRGEVIDTAVLTEDLDWLNRSPFRETRALFAPASALGETNLTVTATPRTPYRLYAGWVNTGAQSTGTDRFYVGAITALPVLRDAYASYQLTGSSDFWKDGGTFFKNQPRYVAQGGRLYVPTFARQNLEFTLSDALTNQKVNADFSVRQRTTEVTLGYRSALSAIDLPAGSGDILFAVEGKRQNRQIFFGGTRVVDLSADIWQGLVGWSKGWLGNGSQALASVSLHVSPGGISERSSAERLAAITNGRSTSDRYGYVTADMSGSQVLSRDITINGQVSAQYSSGPLPLPAQIGLGGDGLVRGYTPDDGSFDAGVLSRTELRLPSYAIFARTGASQDRLSPYLFFDTGYGRDRMLKTNTTLASAGVGADYAMGRRFSAGFNSAWALKDGQRTQRGDWRIQARTTVTF